MNFHQNWLIDECARNILAKISELHKDGVFFVRCGRTDVLNKQGKKLFIRT